LLKSDNDEIYSIENSVWFQDKVGRVYNFHKHIYLAYWGILRSCLTSVEEYSLMHQKDNRLSPKSDHLLINVRFSTFIDDFEELYQIHHPFKVIGDKLRVTLQKDVSSIYLLHYSEFTHWWLIWDFFDSHAALFHPQAKIQIINSKNVSHLELQKVEAIFFKKLKKLSVGLRTYWFNFLTIVWCLQER